MERDTMRGQARWEARKQEEAWLTGIGGLQSARRAAVSAVARVARGNAVQIQMRGFIAPTVSRRGVFSPLL
jgi:hypothetical protein